MQRSKPWLMTMVVSAVAFAGCAAEATAPAATAGQATWDGPVLEAENNSSVDKGADKFEDGPGEIACEKADGRPAKCQDDMASNKMSGCDVLTVAIRIDIEKARAFLPPGYEAQDGGHMLGLSNSIPNTVETGKAVLPIAGMNCRHTEATGGPATFGMAWIDIEPPRAGNRTSPSMEHDGYDILQFTSSVDHAALLERFKLDVEFVGVSMEVANTSSQGVAVAVGTLEIVGVHGPLVTIEVVGAGAAGIGGVTLASWHQVDDGVSLAHLKGTSISEAIVTKATTCRLAEGSPLAELLGDTDCTVAAANGFLATGVDIDGTLEFMGGAKAQEES